MRAYVMTTGIIFALLVVAHAWRIVVEPHLWHDPWWFLITGAALALAVWAFSLMRGGRVGAPR